MHNLVAQNRKKVVDEPLFCLFFPYRYWLGLSLDEFFQNLIVCFVRLLLGMF